MTVGSSDDSRILKSPSISHIELISGSIPSYPRSLPYSAVLIPVRTISLYPRLTRPSTSSVISSLFLLLTLPLAYGIMQYEQNLSHPSCILMNAIVRPSISVMTPSSSYLFRSSSVSISLIPAPSERRSITLSNTRLFSLVPVTTETPSICDTVSLSIWA